MSSNLTHAAEPGTYLLVLFMLLVACHGDNSKMGDNRRIPLTVLPESYAICRLDPRDPVPDWAANAGAGMSSVSRTPDELSLIVLDSLAPRSVHCERGWRVFKVQGPLPFNLVGVIAGLAGTLANAHISIFALSTFETDYVMVKQENLDRAERALREAGYPFPSPVSAAQKRAR